MGIGRYQRVLIGLWCTVTVSPIFAELPVKDVKVLVLNFDPRIPSESNQLVRDVLGFHNPHDLAYDHRKAVAEVSGGHINYQIVGWKDIDAIPAKQDGFSYTPEQYVNLWRSGGPFHTPDIANYSTILNDHVSPALINAGLVDEVWLFGGPWFGFYESAMAGPRSFYINGGVYPDFPTNHPFAIVGFNYERGGNGDGMLHGLGHRAESSISHFFGGWNIQQPQTLWDKYTANVAQTITGPPYGLGSIHYPANGTQDYDYNNSQVVESTAPDWENYPNLTGATALVSADTWGNSEDGYMRYWFSHLPREEGIHPTAQKLNNWWSYIYDFDNIEVNGLPKGTPIKGPDGRYYVYVENQGLSWNSALTGASTLTFGNYSGHLVTITSQAEMDFVTTIANGRETWIGATDSVAEGVWRWAAGPEEGHVFFNSGTPAGFVGWGPGEPNGGVGESVAHMLANGKWNDVSGSYPGNQGYIVEFSIISGDYNWDGHVDVDDYVLWRQTFGSMTNLAADGSGNGVVDAVDYAIWRDHLGEMSESSFTELATRNVPEPLATGLTFVGVAMLCGCRFYRSSGSFVASSF